MSARSFGREEADLPSLNDLLSQADPHENDIFYEPRLAEAFPLRTTEARPSPTSHLLGSFSKPIYVEAAEFRMPLPPALDINRQLTLLTASKQFGAPTKTLIVDIEPSNYKTLSLGEVSAPLYGDDFPSEAVEYYVYTPDTTENAAFKSNSSEAFTEEPEYSTSVSVSKSVSISNNSKSPTDATLAVLTKIESPEIPSTPSSLSSTTISNFQSETLVTSEVPTAEKLVSYDFEEDYPEHSVLSPLAHILGGFRGELGPFGGDHASDGFVRGFRPIGF